MLFRKSYLLKNKVGRFILVVVTSALTAFIIWIYHFFSNSKSEQPSGTIHDSNVMDLAIVNALGRIEPQEVIALSPTPSIEGVRLAKLLVKERDSIASGELVAILDSHNRLQAALEETQEQVPPCDLE